MSPNFKLMREILAELLSGILRELFVGGAEWSMRRWLVRDRAAVVGERRVVAYSRSLKGLALVTLLLIVGTGAVVWNESAPERATYLFVLGLALLPAAYWVLETFTRRVTFDRSGFSVRSWRGTSSEMGWRSIKSWRLVAWRDVHALETEHGVVRLSTWLSGADEFMNVMKRRRSRKS